MIVLDEQLLGRNIEREISNWYDGKVLFIIDLRPYTIIKDDAIPALLRQENQPTFITINEKDFWRRVDIDDRFCIICLLLPDSRVSEIPAILQSIFRLPEFKTKADRMGKVVRVADEKIYFYTCHDKQVQELN